MQPAVDTQSTSRRSSRSHSLVADASTEVSSPVKASTSVPSQLTHHAGAVIEDILTLVPCGEEQNRTEPSGSVYLYSHCHERLSANAAGQLSWLNKVDESCVWTVQPSLATSGKFTLRSKYGLFLSHDLLWGYHANRVHSSTWEEFDLALLPSIYPTFGAKVAFRLRSWMSGILCRGRSPKMVVSRLILDETFGNKMAASAEKTGTVIRFYYYIILYALVCVGIICFYAFLTFLTSYFPDFRSGPVGDDIPSVCALAVSCRRHSGTQKVD